MTNSGDRSGDEIVQLYFGCEGSRVARAEHVLIGFRRVSLESGESLEVALPIEGRSLAFYDAEAQDFVGSFLGRLLLFGWTLCLFFHLCNGIRHLMWDAGYGFDLEQAYRSGWLVVVAAGVLTLVFWILGFILTGGGS